MNPDTRKEALRTCRCGHDAWFHFREVLEVTERVIVSGGVDVTVSESKTRRGSCSRCVGCLEFREVEK